MLVLLSGGSYAALAAFAGERESGTLETLLVQPVPSLDIVWGKFGSVLATLKNQLATAQNTIEKTGTRTRAMERRLRSVEEIPEDRARELLDLTDDEDGLPIED